MVHPDIQHLIQGDETPKEKREILRKHLEVERLDVYSIICRFYTANYPNGGKLGYHINNINNLVSWMMAAGRTINDADKIAALLHKLPPKFNTTREIIEGTKPLMSYEN